MYGVLWLTTLTELLRKCFRTDGLSYQRFLPRDARGAINQSINLFAKQQAAMRQESIELAAHGHIHTIKPQL